MFQKIYINYCEIDNREENNYLMLLAIMSENIQANQKNEKVEYSRYKVENNQPFLQNVNIPYDLNDIQQISMQVCKCDEIGFDPNGRWKIFICTLNFFYR